MYELLFRALTIDAKRKYRNAFNINWCSVKHEIASSNMVVVLIKFDAFQAHFGPPAYYMYVEVANELKTMHFPEAYLNTDRLKIQNKLHHHIHLHKINILLV